MSRLGHYLHLHPCLQLRSCCRCVEGRTPGHRNMSTVGGPGPRSRIHKHRARHCHPMFSNPHDPTAEDATPAQGLGDLCIRRGRTVSLLSTSVATCRTDCPLGCALLVFFGWPSYTILRAISNVRILDFSWLGMRISDICIVSTKNAVVLDTIEIGTALVCACLPIYRPLLPKELPLTRHLTTWLSSIRSTWRLSRSRAKRSAGASPTSDSKPLRNNDDDKKGFHRFDGHSQEERHFASEVGGDKKGRNIVVGKGDYPMHEIEVQKTIDIV